MEGQDNTADDLRLRGYFDGSSWLERAHLHPAQPRLGFAALRASRGAAESAETKRRRATTARSISSPPLLNSASSAAPREILRAAGCAHLAEIPRTMALTRSHGRLIRDAVPSPLV